MAREDAEHHVAAEQPVLERLGAGRLDEAQSVAGHRREDAHHLPVAIGRALELLAHPPERTRQDPVAEGRAVAQRPRLAHQHGHVVPGIVDGLIAAEAACMLGHDTPVLAHHDPLGVGAHFRRASDSAGHDRVSVAVELHQAGLGHGNGAGLETVERLDAWHQARALDLEHLPHRLVAALGVGMVLGIVDTAVRQPAVQVIQRAEPGLRLEEPRPQGADLVLHLAFLPARGRRAGGRLDQVVAAHLQEAPVEHSLAPDEHAVHRGAHVVVDAALAGAVKEGERAVMRVKHHLLHLARVGAHERHPAVAQPDLRHVHQHRGATNLHGLLRPVELVGLAQREAQRDVGLARDAALLALPRPGIAAHRVVAATEPARTQLLVDAQQVHPLAPRQPVVVGQQLLQLARPGAKPGPGLKLALVGEGRLARA